MPNKILLNAGDRFGILTVIGFSHVNARVQRCFECECDCGKRIVVPGSTLISRQQSCGCLARAKAKATLSKKLTTHGMSETPEWRTWKSMRLRCNNPNNPGFYLYGGRGIKVCERWQTFENFYADMGNRPEGMSIDRIDVNGDYEPGNCRWATPKEQSNNRRDNHLLTHNGETHTITEWASIKNLTAPTIHSRLLDSWPIEQVLEVPLGALGRDEVTGRYVNTAAL